MWLLPIFSLVANVACRIFYRLRVAGPRPPRTGPALLVANHPNALLDPACVAAAAGRPVRFLAKAPLFDDRLLGWLVRGAGAIPVYRRIDDPSQMERNLQMFRAAHRALADGAAIGLFPEGTSHDHPEIQPLKTGAARIALGTASLLGDAFPIVPVGLVLRGKERFRSQALVVHGPTVEWQDLAQRSEDDREAVHELTGRIDAALRRVTLNLESWEDRPLLECAQAVWETHAVATREGVTRAPKADPAERMRQLEVATRLLAGWRERPLADDPGLADDLRSHGRRLERLGLSPRLLASDVGLRAAARWTVQRLYLLALPALILATGGWALFYIPFRLTGWITALARPKPDQTATYKLLIGAVTYLLWIVLVAVAAGLAVGRGAGALAGVAVAGSTLLAVPAIGMVGLALRERWRGAAVDLRRFFFLRSRRQLIERLERRQAELAERIGRLIAQSAGDPAGIAPPANDSGP